MGLQSSVPFSSKKKPLEQFVWLSSVAVVWLSMSAGLVGRPSVDASSPGYCEDNHYDIVESLSLVEKLSSSQR